jgi:hypothetical protein
MADLSRKKEKDNPFYFRGLFFIFCLFFSSLMAQEYAFMYIANGSTEVSASTSWTTVGTFSSTLSSTNWSYASNTLTAANVDTVEGTYLIKYSISFNADPAVWSIGVSIDDAVPTEPIFTRTIGTGKELDHGNMSGSLIISISKNQTVKLKIKNDTGSLNYTPVDVQVVVVKVKEASVNYYGGMHISSDQTYTALSSAAGVYAKLTGFAAFDEMNDWTFSTSELTAGNNATGIYYAALSVSFTGDEQGVNIADCSFRIVNNGSPTNIFAIRKTGSTDIGNISAAGLISISASDVISVEAAQDIKNLDLIVKKATLTLYKLSDESKASSAGMKITSDQSVTISTQNTWTTIGTYTLDSNNGWSYSANTFTPSLVSTYGYSHIDYAVSVTTTNAAGDDLELGVFIGTTNHPEFTTMRRLSSNTSIGAVSGNGIFLVNGPDSTITLKVRNTTSANNITIKKSYLSVNQFRYVYSDVPLPITLNNFNAFQDKSVVRLSWSTATETDNAHFLIYRNDELIATIEGAGHSSETRLYNVIDQHVIPGKTYTYVLADQNYEGLITKHDDFKKVITVGEGNIGKDYSVGHAYPNPFNPVSAIPVNLALETDLLAELYDLSGKRVQVIYCGLISPGSYDLSIDGRTLNTGIYFIKVSIGDEVIYRKVTLLK